MENLKKAFSAVVWCFFILLPFVHSNKTLDPVLLPTWLFLIGSSFVLLLILMVVKKQSLVIPKLPKVFWIAILGFSILQLASFAYAYNPNEASFSSMRWVTTLIWMLFVLTGLGTGIVSNQTIIRSISLSGLMFGLISLFNFFGITMLEFTENNGINGTLANSNLTASYMCMVFPLALALTIEKGNWRKIGIASVLVVSIVIALTESRTSYAVYIIELVFGYWFLTRHYQSRILKWIIPSVVMVSITIGLYSYYKIDKTHFLNLFSGNTFKLRTKLWNNSFEMIKDYPLQGVGAGNWKIYFPKYNLNDLQERARMGAVAYVRPHNDYIWIASENGILTLLIYLVILFYLFRYGFLILKEKEINQEKFVVVSFIGFTLIGLMDFPTERVSHLAVVGSIMAIILANRSDKIQIKKAGLAVLLIPLGVAYNIGDNRIDGEAFSAQLQGAYATQNGNLMMRYVQKPLPDYYDLDPAVVPVNYFKAMAYAANAKPNLAIPYFEKAIEAHPYHLLTHNNLGIMYRNISQFEKAVYHFEVAESISPKYFRASYNLVDCLFKKGDVMAGLKKFQSLEQLPKNKEYQYIKRVTLKNILSYGLDKHPELARDEQYVSFVTNYKKFQKMYDKSYARGEWIISRMLPFPSDSLGNRLE